MATAKILNFKNAGEDFKKKKAQRARRIKELLGPGKIIAKPSEPSISTGLSTKPAEQPSPTAGLPDYMPADSLLDYSDFPKLTEGKGVMWPWDYPRRDEEDGFTG